MTTPERAEVGNDFGPDILGSKVSALQQEILAKVDEIESTKTALREKEEQLKSIKETIEGKYDFQKKAGCGTKSFDYHALLSYFLI